jgi:hypothetical protein
MNRRPHNSTRVLLLYDDLDSGVYATEFFDRIAKMLHDDISMNFHIWNFESIHLTMLYKSIYESALNADIIAFAVQENHPIPAWISEWSQSWLELKQPGSCALLGILVNENWSSVYPEHPDLKPIRQLARSSGMDFFTQNTFLSDPIASNATA